MIPIIAISNFFNGVIAAILAVRIFSHHRKIPPNSHAQTIGAHYFIALYAGLAAMWLLYAIPGIFTSDITIITLTQIAATALLYVTSIIAMQITFVATDNKLAGMILSIFILILGLTYIVSEKLYGLTYIQVVSPPYVYWHPATPVWLAAMTGITGAFSTIVFIIMFCIHGLRAKSNYAVYTRAMHLAFGMAFLFSASILYFLLSSSGGLVLATTASILGIIGLLIMHRGIQY